MWNTWCGSSCSGLSALLLCMNPCIWDSGHPVFLPWDGADCHPECAELQGRKMWMIIHYSVRSHVLPLTGFNSENKHVFCVFSKSPFFLFKHGVSQSVRPLAAHGHTCMPTRIHRKILGVQVLFCWAWIDKLNYAKQSQSLGSIVCVSDELKWGELYNEDIAQIMGFFFFLSILSSEYRLVSSFSDQALQKQNRLSTRTKKWCFFFLNKNSKSKLHLL